MHEQEFINKLDFHIQDFQEGFNILISSKNKKDIELNYYRILKGNLLVKKVKLFYFEGDNSWEQVYPKTSDQITADFPTSINMNYIKNYPAQDEHSIVVLFENNEGYATVVSNKFDGTDFQEEDILNFKLFAQLLYYGYKAFKMIKKEKNLIFSLNNKVMQLNTLIDTGIELAKLENVSQLISLSLERAVTITNSSKGMVKIINSNNSDQFVFFPLDFDFVKDDYDTDFIISADLEFQELKIEYHLLEKESRKGIIKFDETDKLLVEAIVKQVHAALENDFLMHQLIDKQKMQKELDLAAEIQRKIIPEKFPAIDGYKVFGINVPSKEVGGDYFDVIELKDGRIALIVADVAGKGIPAALLVSTLNASLTAFLDTNLTSSELAVKLNSLIFKASTMNRYITCFLAILNPVTGELSIVNAGHNPALILENDGKINMIKAGGFALGMFNVNVKYKFVNTTLKSGERILIFSDGVTEAMNQAKEEFSDERLEKFFINYTPDHPKEFVDRLINDLKVHCGDTLQSDDITVLYLQRD